MLMMRKKSGQFLVVLCALLLPVSVAAFSNAVEQTDDGSMVIAQAEEPAQPAAEPAAQPAAEPVAQPAAEEPAQPAAEPAAQPAVEPAAQPAAEPVAQPTAEQPAGPPCADQSGIAYPETLQDGARPFQVLITSVDFVSDIIVLKNVSAEPITFDDTWRLYTFGYHCVLTNLSLAPGATVNMHLIDSGMNDAEHFYCNAYPARIEACSGEAALIHNTQGANVGWYRNPDFVQSFVMWGGGYHPGSAGETFNDEAVGAGAWTGGYTDTSSYVQVGFHDYEHVRCYASPVNAEANDLGIVATGDITTPGGWTRVLPGQESCFPY